MVMGWGSQRETICELTFTEKVAEVYTLYIQ